MSVLRRYKKSFRDVFGGVVETRISRVAVVEGLFLVFNFFAARVLIMDSANPFSVAYLSAFLFRGNRFYIAAALSAAGVVSVFRGAQSMEYLLAIVLMCVLNLLLRTRKDDGFVKSGAAGICAVVAGIGLTVFRGDGIYFIVLNLLEGALIFAAAIALGKGIGIFDGRVKRGSLNNEEIISVALILGVVAVGAADISLGVVSLRYFFAALIVLLAARAGGAAMAACVGVMLGFLLHIGGFEYIYFAVLLAAAGFGAGAARRNRIVAVGVFAGVGLLCALFFNTSLLNLTVLFSILIAGAVSYFIPPRYLPNIHVAINPAIEESSDVMSRVNERVVGRIAGFARGYQKLALAFAGLVTTEKHLGHQEVQQLLRDVRASCCTGCPKELVCWEKEDVASLILELAAICAETGTADIQDAAPKLESLCISAQKLITTINHEYEICCINFEWRNKLAQARGVIGQQLAGAAQVLENFGNEMEARLKFYTRAENEILQGLSLEKLSIRSVSVMRGADGRPEAQVVWRRPADRGLSTIVEDIVSRAVRHKMELTSETPIHEGGLKLHRMEFAHVPAYGLAWGIARANKNNATASGDSFSLITPNCGRVIMALSDGMGHGIPAQEESRTAIELLEEFMEQGFDNDTAFSLINSALLLKSSEELFSTLDICTIDLDSGQAEFVKMGASATVLLRGGVVETINSQTLPVGILENVDKHTEQTQLKHGDIIVMMTDGVADSDLADNPKESWLIRALQSMAGGHPEDIAEYILAKGKANYGCDVKDDMTVLVGRVYERT